ncbi:MAG TPA: alpha/beta hydrolase [Novosphingobium sp.]|nr:alpha/beta hydrolase [Novosphingobium sp.]
MLIVVLAAAGWAALALAGAFSISLPELRARYGTPASRYVMVDGVELSLRDEGPRTVDGQDAPVLMLIHGHYQSLRLWDAWAGPLARHMRVIRIDMPPYGLSGPDPSGRYSPQRVEQLIERLAAQMHLRHFAIGGISTGSAIAMRYTLAHPGQIDRLVLVNAPLVPIAPSMQPKSSWVMTQLESWVFRPIWRPRWFYAYLLRRLFADPARVTPALIDETYDMHRKPGNAATLDTFTRALRFEAKDYGRRSTSTSAQLAQVKVPTLVLWGGAGTMLPVSVGCRVAATLAGAPHRLVVYPGAGHFLPMEAPQAAGDIAAFMATPAAQVGGVANTRCPA